MDQEIKKRYQELKRKNSRYTRERRWKSNTLLQECLSALGSNKIILNMDQQKWVLDKFNSDLPRLMRCDGKNIQSIQGMLPQWINKRVYIVWDENDLPIIETDFECVQAHVEDIIAVAFDTWIVEKKMNQFIRFGTGDKIIEISFEDI